MTKLAPAFEVKVNGVKHDIVEAEARGSAVSLELGSPLSFGDTVTVKYTQPAEGRIIDLAGNLLANFDDMNVDLEIPDPNESDPPNFKDAKSSDTGDEIRVSFNEPITREIIKPEPPRMLEFEAERSVPDRYSVAEFAIRASWTRGIESTRDEHDYYEYRYQKTTGGTWSDWLRTEFEEAEIEGLDAQTQYDFEVRAVNGAGAGASIDGMVTTPDPLPAGPTNDTHNGPYRVGPNDFILFWRGVPDGAVGILIQMRENAQSEWVVQERRDGITTTEIFPGTGNNTRNFIDVPANITGWQLRYRAVDSGGNPVTRWGTPLTLPAR